jgi:hypothetical protein
MVAALLVIRNFIALTIAKRLNESRKLDKILLPKLQEFAEFDKKLLHLPRGEYQRSNLNRGVEIILSG